MRICLYTNTALPKLGGQEIVVDALARQFLALGHEPVVLAPWRGSQGPFDPASVPYPVAWHPRFLSTHWFVSWYGHWMAKLHRSRGFDVIHCHGTYPAGYVGACCKAVRHLPLVITSHGDDLAPLGLYDRKPKLRGRYRLALEQADAAVAISNYTAGMFREACPKLRRIVPIPNGVEVEQFAAPAPRPANLRRHRSARSPICSSWAGSIRGKGSTCCWRRWPCCAANAISTWSWRDADRKARPWKPWPRGSVLPGRSISSAKTAGRQKLWLLQNGLCTIVPSRTWEAFGVVVVESFAAGRPVIASQLPGLADLVQPGRTGLLVPPESPQRLAEAIRQMVADPQRADDWGHAARQFVQAFRLEKHCPAASGIVCRIDRRRASPRRVLRQARGNGREAGKSSARALMADAAVAPRSD